MNKNLTFEKRCQLEILKKEGLSLRKIAKRIGVSHSTISREIRRNGSRTNYRAVKAERKAKKRRGKRYSVMHKATISLIKEKLKSGWSPVQIAGRFKKEGIPSPSYATIYRYIRLDKANKGTLYRKLRRKGKKYNRRGLRLSGRGIIPRRIDISQRPKIVEEKTRIGDWEVDTIVGSGGKSVILSMVDRATKFVILCKVEDRKAESIKRAMIQRFYSIRTQVLTITADNGKEFAKHMDIAKKLKAGFFFATPYRSCERGLNEHTNGLFREYFPKGTNFDNITKNEVKNVEKLLNTRPRKVLHFATPTEAFYGTITNPKVVRLE